LLLTFPTGSKSIKPGDALGALVFHQDGSWDFRPHPDADIDDLFTIREFVDFITYSMKSTEHVRMFRDYQDQTDEEKIQQYRRENIRLVHSNTGSK
tara:strand:+ start:329 stop:616 length:288 start_codon:yes stop_codon:yes gene_type:complete